MFVGPVTFCGSGGKVPNGLSAIVIASQAAVAAAASCVSSDVPAALVSPAEAAGAVLPPQTSPSTHNSHTQSVQNESPQLAHPSSPLRPAFKIEDGEGLHGSDTMCA
jgi:hypothetical protein